MIHFAICVLMLYNSGGTAVPGLFRSRSLPQLLYATDSGLGSFSDGGQPQNNTQRSQGDFRQLLTLKQHYYLEGGWGWVIFVIAIIVQTLTHGLQVGYGIMVCECEKKFGSGVVYLAGMRRILLYLPYITPTRTSFTWKAKAEMNSHEGR